MGVDKGFQPVPLNERKPWLAVASVWAGAVICIPALLIGGTVASGLGLTTTMVVIAAGYLIIALLVFAFGWIGAKEGLPATATARKVYGLWGSRLFVSLIIGVALGGWFGVQTSVCANSFSAMVKSLTGLEVPLWLSIILWGAIMTQTAVKGYGGLEMLGKLTVPILVILSVWGSWAGVSSSGGWARILEYQPAESLTVVTALSIVVGWFASGVCVAPDLCRYAKPAMRDVALVALMGIVPAGMVLSGSGAIMLIASGNPDVTASMVSLGLGVPALVLVILATWTTNVLNVYSGGLALTDAFGLEGTRRTLVTAMVGVVGTVLSLGGIAESLTPFLLLLTVLLPPYLGVMLAAEYVVKGEDRSESPIHWPAVVSWAVGCVTASFIKAGVPFLQGIAAAMVAYIVLESLRRPSRG